MSFYTWQQKRRFYATALNRHGVHSPFVYDFVEQVLNGHYVPGAPLPELPGLSPEAARLAGLMAAYYGCRSIEAAGSIPLELPEAAGSQVAAMYFDKIIVINDIAAGIPDKMLQGAALQDCILVAGDIYRARAATAAWSALLADTGATLCLDLFNMGLLFFKPDFLVRQYFRLKY